MPEMACELFELERIASMNELNDGTCGFVLEVGEPEYDCQICAAQLEKQGKPTCEACAAEYEFVADTGERVFFCAQCFEEYFSPEKEGETWLPAAERC
jgi:hypothetical protein